MPFSFGCFFSHPFFWNHFRSAVPPSPPLFPGPRHPRSIELALTTLFCMRFRSLSPCWLPIGGGAGCGGEKASACHHVDGRPGTFLDLNLLFPPLSQPVLARARTDRHLPAPALRPPCAGASRLRHPRWAPWGPPFPFLFTFVYCSICVASSLQFLAVVLAVKSPAWSH